MASTPTFPPIAEQLKPYLETRLKLPKYQGIDKAGAVIAGVITDVVTPLLALLTFIFFSITPALFAAHLLNFALEGFGCLTLLYVVTTLSARLLRGRLHNLFIRKFIEKLFCKRNG